MAYTRRDAHRIAVIYAIVAAVITFLPLLIAPSLIATLVTLTLGICAVLGALWLSVWLTDGK